MKLTRLIGMGLVIAVCSLATYAQTTPQGVEPYEEFGKHLRAAQEVSPLTSGLFGDQVSLYNGASEFDVTDIDLPGNSGLPVRLSRRLVIEDKRIDQGNLGGFSDWNLDVPYIDGLFTQQNGWEVLASDYKSPSTARCSITNPVYTRLNASTVAPVSSVWDGNQLHIPGESGGELLRNSEAKLPAVADGQTYPWITKDFYRASCLSSTANGYPGEAFSVLSPSGVRYTFNWAVVNVAPVLVYQATNTNGSTYQATVSRSHIYLLATRIDDRFGNWVTYTYNGNQLTRIAANDGREIDLTWSGNTVTSATAGARTWSYGYASDGTLNTVMRPDKKSQWRYSVISGTLKTAKNHDYSPPPNSHCQLTPDPNTGDMVYSIDAPSGAHGVFHFVYERNFRTYVPYSCTLYNPYTVYPDIDDFFDNFALVSKQISGAGLATQSWSYDYGSNPGGYFTPSLPASTNYGETYTPPGDCSGCAVSKVVTVTSPGDITKYTFGVAYARNEGRLLQTEIDSPTGTTVKTVTNTYLDDSQIGSQAFPDNAGVTVQSIAKNPMVGRIRPVVTVTTAQDGDTYTRQTEAFDVFAHPTKVMRSNGIAGQSAIEEQTAYLNDLPHWVLGLPTEVDNLTTVEVESTNTYDLGNVVLLSNTRFGQLVMSYTYQPDGNLASFTDGNGHTTSLSNYYRGVPQVIHHPDGTSQSAVVDAYGEITAVTDQAGRTSTYTYDASGWPSQISYPAGDEVAWYPKTFDFTYATTIERGIAAGHWRRTIRTGSASEVTYFDAMLRPLLTDSSIGGGADISAVNSFDWRGLPTFASYPVSGSPDVGGVTIGTRKSYDTLGRLIQSQQDSELGGLTTVTAYLAGAGVQVTDPKGNATLTRYQVFDEPAYSTPILVQAPGGITQSIARDLYGNPLSITQSGLYNGTETDSATKSFTYDSYHRLCRTTEPESGSQVMGYDGANNLSFTAMGLSSGVGCLLANQVPATAETSYTYDPMNRVLTIGPPSGTQSTQYTYDALGQRKSAASGTTLWNGTYNYRGMLTGESLSVIGQDVMALGYAHDAYGNLSLIHYPDGENVSYAPDARGRPTQVGGYASAISTFPSGGVASFLYGNGTGYVASQNTRQLPSNFSYGNGGTLNVSEDLAYDPSGNLTGINDLTGGPRSKVFSYDGLNRLAQAQASKLWGTESYTYDALNNLRTRTYAGQVSTYNYDPTNRLSTITRGGSTSSSFVYDNRGNVINKNGAVLLFDQKNQLNQIQGYDSYAYDADGRRVQKTPANGGASTYYFYSHAGQLMYQVDAGAARTTNFIYLGTKLIARNTSPQVPVAPGSLSVPPASYDGGAGLTWAASRLATTYVLEQSSNGGGTWVSIYNGAGTSTAVSGLADGSYSYHVKACGANGCSGWTNGSAILVVTHPPTTAPSLSTPSQSTNGNYTVGWSGVAGQVSYTLQEQLNGGAWTTVQTAGTTNWVASAHGNGTYGYRVQACNAGGCGPWSAIASTSVWLPPPAPSSISVPASSNGPLAISWASSATATSYGLDQSINGGAWSQIYASSAVSTSLVASTAGTYSYRAYACNASGCSGYASGAASVTGPGLSVPGSSNTGSYTVSWNGSAGATSYTLQEQINSGGWTTVQANGAVSWSTSGRGNGSYGYHVQACNAGGCGPWSPVGSISVALPAPAPASVTAPSYVHGTTFYVSWTAATTATSYNVRSSNLDTGTSLIAATTAGTSAVMPAPTTSHTFQYAVQACNAVGCSAFTNAPNTTYTDRAGPIQ